MLLRTWSIWARLWLGVMIGAGFFVLYFWVAVYLVHEGQQEEKTHAPAPNQQAGVLPSGLECICSCDGDKAELEIRPREMEKLDVD